MIYTFSDPHVSSLNSIQTFFLFLLKQMLSFFPSPHLDSDENEEIVFILI